MTLVERPNPFRHSISVWTMMSLLLLSIRGTSGLVSRRVISPSPFRQVAKQGRAGYSTTTISLKSTADAIENPLSITSSGEENRGGDGLPRIFLKRNRRTKSFRDGSQLVFTGSIGKTPESLPVGSLVQVEVAGQNKDSPTIVVGFGLYNPASLYRVRIIFHCLLHPEITKQFLAMSNDSEDGDAMIIEKILTMNFQRALQTRRGIGLPSESKTDTYRLVNGEGDSISGLAVDVIGNKIAVVMSSAAWCEIHKSTILKSLQQTLPDHDLIWKTTPSRLKQDGFAVGDDDDINDDEENKDKKPIDNIDEPVVCLENGIKYQTFPRQKGQKTSVYCDQRDNRLNLAQLCEGKKVLDLCCYHGGFSLNAVKNGAALAVGVDSSADAIETCKVNAGLNNFDNENINFIKSDIAEYMKTCEDKFDVIVLDPPKLAPSATNLQRASRKYHSLNRDAIKLIDDKGGLFMTCTCSAAMTQKEGGKFFLETVQQASIPAQREVTLLRVSGAAACHTESPFSFPAGNYLTAALFYVHPKLESLDL